jgi:hypothetical protein
MSGQNRRQGALIVEHCDDEQHRGRCRTEDAALVMNDVVKVDKRPTLTVGTLIQQRRQNLRGRRNVGLAGIRMCNSGPVGLCQEILGPHQRKHRARLRRNFDCSMAKHL